MGFLGSLFSKAKSFVQKVVTKVPEYAVKAQAMLPKVKAGVAQVKALAENLPDKVKGPLLSALGTAESMMPHAENVINKLAGGGNSDAAGGGAKEGPAQAEAGAPAVAAA